MLCVGWSGHPRCSAGGSGRFKVPPASAIDRPSRRMDQGLQGGKPADAKRFAYSGRSAGALVGTWPAAAEAIEWDAAG